MGTDPLEHEHGLCRAESNERSRKLNTCDRGMRACNNSSFIIIRYKGASTQHHNQQVLVKPRHNPSNRDQQVREITTKSENQKPSAYSTWRGDITNCT